jgi:hypothetical protein
MKTFNEWLQNKLKNESNEDQEAFDKINQALKKAGLPWDQDEFNVLYGKWVDMTIYLGNGQQRVQGVIYPEEVKQDEDHYGPYPVGFQINLKSFYPTSIVEIHDIKIKQKYDDMISDYLDDMDYQRTLKSLPY